MLPFCLSGLQGWRVADGEGSSMAPISTLFSPSLSRYPVYCQESDKIAPLRMFALAPIVIRATAGKVPNYLTGKLTRVEFSGEEYSAGTTVDCSRVTQCE